jgi:hypothetical protein
MYDVQIASLVLSADELMDLFIHVFGEPSPKGSMWIPSRLLSWRTDDEKEFIDLCLIAEMTGLHRDLCYARMDQDAARLENIGNELYKRLADGEEKFCSMEFCKRIEDFADQIVNANPKNLSNLSWEIKKFLLQREDAIF